jgi:hypothetical protein
MGQRSHLFYTPPGEGGMPQFMRRTLLRAHRGPFRFRLRPRGRPRTRNGRPVLRAHAAQHRVAERRQVLAAARLRRRGRDRSWPRSRPRCSTRTGRRRRSPGAGRPLWHRLVGAVAGRTGTASTRSIESQHEILKGFDDTNWIPGGGYRMPVTAKGAACLSVVPAYTAYPPELSYAPGGTRTDEPAVVVRDDWQGAAPLPLGRRRAHGVALRRH